MLVMHKYVKVDDASHDFSDKASRRRQNLDPTNKARNTPEASDFGNLYN